jgi:hypothetical protein
MRWLIILIFGSFILASCSKVESTSHENAQLISNKIVSVSPTVQADSLLQPVTPKIKLNSKQKKYLDEALPPQVREILEKAEKFEILAEVFGENDTDSMGFYPNRIAGITNEKDKKEILESFYYDASDGDYPSACYVPHHALRATFQSKTVEVEICYQCHIFYVKSPFGKFDGGIVRENVKSENVLNKIIKNQSIELKQ